MDKANRNPSSAMSSGGSGGGLPKKHDPNAFVTGNSGQNHGSSYQNNTQPSHGWEITQPSGNEGSSGHNNNRNNSSHGNMPDDGDDFGGNSSVTRSNRDGHSGNSSSGQTPGRWRAQSQSGGGADGSSNRASLSGGGQTSTSGQADKYSGDNNKNSQSGNGFEAGGQSFSGESTIVLETAKR